MKRSLAAAGALALGAALGTGAMAAYAGWQDQTIMGATIKGGYIHFAAGDPTENPEDLPRISTAGETITWKLPEGMLTNGTRSQAVIQVDAQSQGNRGLAYRLDGVQVSGDGSLAKASTVNIREIQDPAACTSSDTGSDGLYTGTDGLYEGPLTEAHLEKPRVLVTADYSEDPWTDPETDYLCLTLSVPDMTVDYTNIAEVTGKAAGGLGEDKELTAEDSWSGTGVPGEAARDADVAFTFSYQTFRAGGLQ